MREFNDSGNGVSASDNNGFTDDTFSLLGLAFTQTNLLGGREVSSLVDVDSAVTGKIATVFQSLVVSNPDHTRNKRLAAFAAMPINEKIFYGEFQSATEFIKSKVKKAVTKTTFPLVWVQRDPTIVFAEPADNPDRLNVSTIEDDQGEVVATCNQSVVRLSYTVNMVGWHDDNIEQLALLLAMWLRNEPSEQRFTARSLVANAPCELSISFKEGKLITIDGSSEPFNENRLRVLSITATVDAEIVGVRHCTKTTSKIDAGSNIHV